MSVTRREAMQRLLQGERPDHLPVCFYEIGGFEIDPDDPDEFNVYNDPSWRPLLDLSEEQTTFLRFAVPEVKPCHKELHAEHYQTETWREGKSRFTRTTLRSGRRTLTEVVRRDNDADTEWKIEHLIKDNDDVRAFLDLPDELFDVTVDVSPIIRQQEKIGSRGLAMIDTTDPLCEVAYRMDMQDFLLFATLEKKLCRAMLDKMARPLYELTRQTAAGAPGHLWRIYGPEYACQPFMRAPQFAEYVVEYDRPMIEAIHASGGWARLHAHGHLGAVLDLMASMEIDAIDPVEPLPQGDVPLADIIERYGDRWIIFGNIELADIENVPPEQFEKIARRTVEESHLASRGFVLMPTAAPLGRTITPNTLTNYKTMVRVAKEA